MNFLSLFSTTRLNYRMRLTFGGTKLSRIANCSIFADFIFADAVNESTWLTTYIVPGKLRN